MEYRGYTIEKFYSKNPVPKHIIKEYYQSEKLRIDRMINAQELNEENKEKGLIEEDITETINNFMDELGF